MKVSIPIKTRGEKRAVEVAMQDPAVRAFVVICGTLQDLPSDRARRRVLGYVQDLASDPDAFGAAYAVALDVTLPPDDEPER